MGLLDHNDMAKLGCGECNGCSACCRGMGQSILLDPYDMFQMQMALNMDFSSLMQEKIELCVEDGLILPVVRMQPDTDACGFLDQKERCRIHTHRPGLCRLFPLGRKYDENGMHYFLLEDACQIPNRTKVKIRKWLAVPMLSSYEAFLTVWHDLRRDIQEQIRERCQEAFTQKVNVSFLEIFYQKRYDETGDFYGQFEDRRNIFAAIWQQMCS